MQLSIDQGIVHKVKALNLVYKQFISHIRQLKNLGRLSTTDYNLYPISTVYTENVTKFTENLGDFSQILLF